MEIVRPSPKIKIEQQSEYHVSMFRGRVRRVVDSTTDVSMMPVRYRFSRCSSCRDCLHLTKVRMNAVIGGLIASAVGMFCPVYFR